MKVFAIGDLHLSSFKPKSMDIFGDHWADHWRKIKEDWLERVSDEDVVLVCGDLSWAMRLLEALPDLDEICRLPGKKVLLRGNHDYWWSSITKIQEYLFNQTYILQNNHYVFDDVIIVGTRGWTVPNGSTDKTDKEDEAIYAREAIRLSLSLDGARDKREGKKKIAMMHFPPFNEKRQPSEFTQRFEEFGVDQVVYGHLHGEGIKAAFNGTINGIEYSLVSCDFTDFKLKRIDG
jgi:predicted phosphohydrolase